MCIQQIKNDRSHLPQRAITRRRASAVEIMLDSVVLMMHLFFVGSQYALCFMQDPDRRGVHQWSDSSESLSLNA